MSIVVVNRPLRRPAPAIPTGELLVDPPPVIPAETGSRWQQLILVVPMLTGTVAAALLFAGRDGGAFAYVVGAIFGLSTLGMLVTSLSVARPQRADLAVARREYLRHLATLRRQARQTAAKQRAGLAYRHPDPATLWSTVDSYRLWERRAGDPDFAVIRVGLGPQTLATPLVAPQPRASDDLEPLSAVALRRLLDTHSIVADLPVALSLRGFGRVYLRSGARAARGTDGDEARGLVRAMLAALATLHAPSDLLIGVCAGPRRQAEWDWVKWLPHAAHPDATDAIGPLRLICQSLAELEARLADVLAGRAPRDGTDQRPPSPHLVVVLDGVDAVASMTGPRLSTGNGIIGVTLLDLAHPPPRLPGRTEAVLEVSRQRLHIVTVDLRSDIGVPDTLARTEAEALARRIAPMRLDPGVNAATATDRSLVARVPDVPELLGLGDPYLLNPAQAWADRTLGEQLRVPIGVGPDGAPVHLDLKEAAQYGMGPHGLLIGATGSGKSELLRTLVLGLAVTHSPETLNVVLVDFKGGATFTRLDRLPHVAAVITNLADELPLVDRMTDAINGELVRRQELLRRAGNHASLRDYERARAGGAPLAPLPSLLIICDEFAELLTAKPDFIDLFVQIGRVGRSLGMHLLLASQRLDEGRLRGLDTHLSYRIGLRTFSALESRSVLGVPDAYELPDAPGHGYLKHGTGALRRFTAAYVSGPYRVPSSSTGDGPDPPLVRRFDAAIAPMPEPPQPAEADGEGTEAESLLDVLVRRLAGQGPPAHQVWLPPLPDSATLEELLGPVVADREFGVCAANPRLRGGLTIPLALVDRPFEQRRDVLWLRLDGAEGHVAIVGGPQSGKSTTLLTLIASLALTHTPARIQVYGLDFGGGRLGILRDLPHVGGIAGRLEPAAVRRTIAEVATLLATREQRGGEWGVEMIGDDAWGDVFVIVDGWATIRAEFEDLEPAMTDIATRGLSYGIHLVATASRWLDFRPTLRDLFGSRVELRLGDPSDSLAPRRLAANVPQRAPGRGVTTQGLHCLVALPRLSTGDTADLVKSIATGWTGQPAPPVRMLPDTVPYQVLRDEGGGTAEPLRMPIGLGEADLRPVYLDFAADPHLLVFGDTECGKSALLRTLATAISQQLTPKQARIVLVDYRRSLHGTVRTEHLIGYGAAADATAELIASVARYMRRRLPGPDLTTDQLRDRSWWSGPHCFVLVDDYDLVATGGGANPLEPLLEFLPQARDIGLHVVLTRRSGGAARALYEPIVQRLRELSTPGILMSGNRDEGPLLGNIRPGPLPPGRGWLVTRRQAPALIQLAEPPPDEDGA